MTKKRAEDLLNNRFLVLSVITTIVLMAVVIISIESFGEAAWVARKQVGLVMAGEKTAPGRNITHFQGLKDACEDASYELTVKENVPDTAEDGRQAAEEMIRNGAAYIFFMGNNHAANISDLAERYPNVRFFLVGMYVGNNGKIKEYSVRDYEPRYLSGRLAGLHTKTGLVGYVAPYSSSGVNRGINAFVLGVKKSNPNAEVVLAYTGSMNNKDREEQAVQMLKAARVDVLTYHQDGDAVAAAAERLNIDFIAYHELYKSYGQCLGAIEMNWRDAYANMLKSDKQTDINGVNWEGMIDGMLDFSLVKSKLTHRELATIETERANLLNGKPIFAGEIYDRMGVKRCETGESISSRSIRNNMGWLVRGVRLIDN